MRPVDLLVFDGQSFNYAPVPDSGGKTYPYKLQALIGRPVTAAVVGVSSTTWAQRLATAPGRVDWAWGNGQRGILLDTGGPSDLLADKSAATILADAEAYWTARRNAGADKIVAFTVTPSTSYSAPQEAVRVTLNGLLRASAGKDAIVDIAADPNLDDATDATYFYDGLHWTEAGAAIGAGLAATAYASLA